MNAQEQAQGRYIASEGFRYRTLDAIRLRLMPSPTERGREPREYRAEAFKLGLHAQQGDEIAARLAQLDGMARELTSGAWFARQSPMCLQIATEGQGQV
jgi:hypothetical protein